MAQLSSGKCICDGHAREALLATVGPWLGVATKTSNEGQVQIELVHKPVDISSLKLFLQPYRNEFTVFLIKSIICP